MLRGAMATPEPAFNSELGRISFLCNLHLYSLSHEVGRSTQNHWHTYQAMSPPG